jgi:hypothetical protein
MNLLSLGTTLKAAVLAGVVAALVVAVFHSAATEPVIDHAIMLEEQASQQMDAAEPAVSRDTQRFGLIIGMLLYGLTWALIFGCIYQLSQTWLPASTTAARGALLALGTYIAVAFFPFVKYPANPPGVGEPETIVLRQALYLLAIVLGIGGVAIALGLAKSTQDRAEPLRRFAPLGFLAVFGAVAYLVLPNSPDAVRMPADVVGAFRALSLAGLTLFWVLFGAGFVLLVRGAGRQSSAATS